MKKDSKVKKAAKSNDQQVYERSIFPTIFEDMHKRLIWKICRL